MRTTTLLKQAFTGALLLITACSFAQQVTGYVTGSDKKPLEGATVFNRQTGSHTHCNELGFFKLINTRKGDTIEVTQVSYAPAYMVIQSDSLKIVLESTSFSLDEVAITSSVNHLHVISNIDLQTNPVNSSQELLRKVPGLFIGQHAGGGKAEQIFLRGFDIDHGTDINITVDGMPVNMVSHAHGQGYADLHFLIPETVEKIDFDKGPYNATKGNLATAGYVAFQTKERLNNSSITFEGGKFNTMKMQGLLNLVNNDKQAAWIASDYLLTDGYFQSPQHFNRLNLAGKYTAFLNGRDKLSVSFSHLKSKWDASGQIPQRAVDEGLIGRFGAIDNTEGGNTQRTNVNLQFVKQVDESTMLKTSAFYSRYDFELYSNFTFFMNDPVNGDQIRQKEQRNVAGIESQLNKETSLFNTPLLVQAGAGFRYDDVNNIELSHTVNRKTTLQQVQLGDINETNLFGYLNGEWHLGKWLINPGARVDYLKFDYLDQLAPNYLTQSQHKAIISPKLNFLYNHNKNIQYFLKLGKGFHSNDTRVVVAQNGKQILPAAYGADLGMIWKPLPRLVINGALWFLYLQQEFVYVGDEGIVEPSGKTQRKGIDLGVRYQLGKYLFLNGDFTYTHARAMGEAKGEDYIPLAPKVTFVGGVAFSHPSGMNAAIKTRYLGHRPANEDNSIVAKGYCITDFNINYRWKQFTIGVITENIFNSAWNETQFATTSQLKNETEPVTEIHFTPGTPFNFKAALTYKF